MSNKPIIKARCAAGCEWETVHKEDFLAACNLIKVHPTAEGIWNLEVGKQYKIKASDLSKVSITFHHEFKTYGEQAYNIEVPTNDEYATSVVFKVLYASDDDSSLTLVYEIGGVRYIDSISMGGMPTENCLTVENADSVYEYNEDNELRISVEALENSSGAGNVGGASLKSAVISASTIPNLIAQIQNYITNKNFYKLTISTATAIKGTQYTTIINQNTSNEYTTDSDYTVLSANDTLHLYLTRYNNLSYYGFRLDSGDKRIIMSKDDTYFYISEDYTEVGTNDDNSIFTVYRGSSAIVRSDNYLSSMTFTVYYFE